MPTTDQWVDLMLSQTGKQYQWGTSAVGQSPTAFDCSELLFWAGNQLGLEGIPDGSWNQYQWAKANGWLVPVEQAINTRGAVLFRFGTNPDQGMPPDGQRHVAVSLGTGQTIEAKGKNYGVGSFAAAGRFTHAAIIPTMQPSSFSTPASANYQTVSGGQPGANTVPAFDPTKVKSIADLPPDARDFIYQTYGYLSTYLEHEEIGPILLEAAAYRWSFERLQAKIYETSWWQTTQESKREFERRRIEDPATVQAEIDAQTEEVRNLAGQLGVVIAGGRMDQIAISALSLGWTPEQLIDAIVAESKFSSDNPEPAGALGDNAGEIKQMAANQMLNITDQKAFELSQRIAKQELTLSAVETLFRNQAMSLYSEYSDQLRQGVTMDDIFESRRNQIAELLEMDASEVDFIKDSRFQPVVNMVDEKGNARSMTSREVGIHIRGLKDWETTQQAVDAGDQFAQMLGQTFGKVPT